MKFRTAGEGLQGLSPADLPDVRRHRRVVGHVLWLEGKDAKAAISKDPATPGHKDGLADIEIGRASCREMMCPYGVTPVVAVTLINQLHTHTHLHPTTISYS